MLNNAALVAVGSYNVGAVYGVPLVVQSVALGTAGVAGGYTSVVLTHSGSSLGGQYTVSAVTIEDLAGNTISPNAAAFSAFGDQASLEVALASPDDGRTLELTFKDSLGNPQPLLTEAQFSPGVANTSSYEVTTTYPIPPVLASPTQQTAKNRVDIDLHPMTSAQYQLVAGPASVYEYSGTVLPDADPAFTGVEIGTGTSVATGANGLLLSKGVGVSYGWSFGDTTGRMIPGSSYRADIQVNIADATVSPAPYNSSILTLAFSDGAIQINVVLEDVSGTRVLSILSGALSLQVLAAWDVADCTISVVRNQKGSFYSVLFDGVPLSTFAIASATGAATYNAGTAVVLAAAPSVSLLALRDLSVSASSTLFTNAWNFIHGLSVSFTGSSKLSVDRIRTRYGPLVRGWGDDTPATKEDVTLKLNGSAVALSGVNPYVGEIYPAIPIPRAAPGSFTVAADYIWSSNPAVPMVGLNTRGLTLNTWDRAVGHTPGARSPLPATSNGVTKTNRFPMGVVLAPLRRLSPKRIGHRYIGFQKGYSALLNQPTTLLLNQDPHAISVGNVSASAFYENATFPGTRVPTEDPKAWILSGVDTGAVVGDGTYRLIDASSGSYGNGTAALYYRELDLSLPTSVQVSGRFYLESYTLDGVFTGVGFGVYDGNHLLLVGALVVDGVEHVGVLTDGDSPHIESSWEIGPSVSATATAQDTLEFELADMPRGVKAGTRFRIAAGDQAGVYTISECGLVASTTDTTVEATFEPDLPESIKEYGQDSFQLLFETKWSVDLVSLRSEVEFLEGNATVILGGTVSGQIATVSALPPYPAQTALLLPAATKGRSFWGSASRRATNSSIWDLAQYASNPERLVYTVQGLTVQSEMNVVPTQDPNDPWYVVGGFGYAQVDATGDSVVLKSTSASATIDQEFSYRRMEPYLSTKVNTDAEVKFQVESGILGAGDAQVVIKDGVREARLSTLLYTQNGVRRALVTDLPQVSLSGLLAPTSAGWAKGPSFTLPDPLVRGQTLVVTKSASTEGVWQAALATPILADYEGLISEARFSVESSTVGSWGVGVVVAANVPTTTTTVRYVALTLGANALILRSASAAVQTISFAWDDGAAHTYRLLSDPGADIVVVVVDDVVVGSAALSAFPSSTGSATAFVGAWGSGVCSFTLHSTSAVPLRPKAKSGSTLGRTFGILLRDGASDPDDIDSYRIPRADSTQALNSSLTALPVQMDWQTLLHVRLYLDPTWGVSLYRPDIALPPGASEDFATDTTNITSAWATVEYAQLPVSTQYRGSVEFGALDSRSITQQRWGYVRYRIRGDIDGFGIAPQGMVLNRSFTMTSGEFLFDVTPEYATINSRTSTLVYLPDSAVYANRVFVVQVDGNVVSSSAWGFDPI